MPTAMLHSWSEKAVHLVPCSGMYVTDFDRIVYDMCEFEVLGRVLVRPRAFEALHERFRSQSKH
jgi:hypothetical protein